MPEWLGKTIGKVRIEKLLARGGMAEVYLGSHLTLERPVAVKLLHSHIEEEPFLLERFHREAKVVAGLRHPNIVQIFDFDTLDGHPYIVMEYLKGPTLAMYLRHLHQRKKRIPPDQVARLLNRLATALDYAHEQSVVHRDIKPGNIMLHSNTGDIPLDRPLTNDVDAVITDFGLVRIMNTASQTASGMLSGTPAYMSPEQARGDPTDHRTDIYSLGIVLYEMLAGRVPFEADSTLTVLHMQIHTTPPPIPGIPANVQAVIDRALQKNPDDRYQASRELASDYYRSIGMSMKADTIREPYLVNTRPLESSGQTKAELLPEPEQKQEPAVQPAPIPEPEQRYVHTAEPVPTTKPEPLPEFGQKSQAKSTPEPTVKQESPAEPALPPSRELQQKPEPPIKMEPQPKPNRSRTWIGLGLFSLVCLAVLAFGAFRLLSGSGGLLFPNSRETLSPVIPETGTSPLPSPSEAPALPSADRMVRVDAGTYQVGRDSADDFHSASQSITLDEFWVDQYQVTNQDFQQYLAGWAFSPGEENYPVMGVAWDQADAYCKSLNKRLPAEAEWEVAGRGPGENPPLYPWGDDASQAIQLPNHTYEVGSISFNQSPFGVYDMLGNVYEWVGEPYYGSVAAGTKLLRGVRASVPEDLTFRVEVTPEDTNYSRYAGFRCAADQVR